MPEYTLEEYKQIYGEDYMKGLTSNVDLMPVKKPFVYSFNDLDNAAKLIYNNLYNLLSQLNVDFTDLAVFVVGNRVVGEWRSQEEVDDLNQQYNINLEATPYEFCTNATILPSYTQLRDISPDLNLIYNCSNQTHSIIVPPPNE
jgi:hypothetical protein